MLFVNFHEFIKIMFSFAVITAIYDLPCFRSGATYVKAVWFLFSLLTNTSDLAFISCNFFSFQHSCSLLLFTDSSVMFVSYLLSIVKFNSIQPVTVPTSVWHSLIIINNFDMLIVFNLCHRF